MFCFRALRERERRATGSSEERERAVQDEKESDPGARFTYSGNRGSLNGNLFSIDLSTEFATGQTDPTVDANTYHPGPSALHRAATAGIWPAQFGADLLEDLDGKMWQSDMPAIGPYAR
jgi:hypothetical protein